VKLVACGTGLVGRVVKIGVCLEVSGASLMRVRSFGDEGERFGGVRAVKLLWERRVERFILPVIWLVVGQGVLLGFRIMVGWRLVSQGTLWTLACRKMATWGSGYSPQRGPRVCRSRPTPRDNGYSPQQGPRVCLSILIPVAVRTQ
jgi:hypothetical protein